MKCFDCKKEISQRAIRCISCSNRFRKGKYSCKGNLGKKNGMWKGDNVGFIALHVWIKRHKSKPEFCECCGKEKPFDLANISGLYKRDVNDFAWLCRKCHMKKDNRLQEFIQNNKNHSKNYLKGEESHFWIDGRSKKKDYYEKYRKRYYQERYQKNKEKLLMRHKEYYRLNKLKWKEYHQKKLNQNRGGNYER